jgi:hypothetical protein
VNDEVVQVRNQIASHEAATISLEDRVAPTSIENQNYSYIRDKFDVSLKLSSLYYSFESDQHKFNIFGLGIKLEKRFFKRIGLSIGYEWGSDFNKQDEFQSNSTPSSTKTEIGITKSNKTSLGLTFYPYQNFYLSGEVGKINYETESTTANYTILGVKGSESKSISKGTLNFQKIAIGYDSLADQKDDMGFYFEVGILKQGSITYPHMSTGINIGF